MSQLNSMKRDTEASGISESMRVSRPLQVANVPENLTGNVIDFRKKTSEQKSLHSPVNERVKSRVPKEIAVAAALAASPVAAAANYPSKPQTLDRGTVVQHQGDVNHEYKFEMHIHGAEAKQVPELKDEMEKLIKKHMAEAERKRKIEERRQLMDRSKGGMF